MVICTEKVVFKDPFVIHANDTVSALYEMINAKMCYVSASRGISIVFSGKLILNSFDDHRTILDIGMKAEENDIKIIQKPVFVALLEMVSDIKNKEKIPWFDRAMQCLSDPSANRCQNISQWSCGLDCDDSGNLIGVDLSHLNLSGCIYLKSLPQTVLSLDLSYNDLDTLNLTALSGKSVERLNVEINDRCHINTECFTEGAVQDPNPILSIEELQISSNQIFPWITDDLEYKHRRIKRLMNRHSYLEQVIVDGHVISRSTDQIPIHSRMLKVIDGVTNKELIPWYTLFSRGCKIQPREWRNYRVQYMRRKQGYSARYRFDLSGLGLEGHIDLGYLTKNVIKMDLSKNNLSSISFESRGHYKFNLRALNIEHNDNVRIDLREMDFSSPKWSSLVHLLRFSVSSNQLVHVDAFNSMSRAEYVALWVSNTPIHEVVLDGKVYANKHWIKRYQARHTKLHHLSRHFEQTMELLQSF